MVRCGPLWSAPHGPQGMYMLNCSTMTLMHLFVLFNAKRFKHPWQHPLACIHTDRHTDATRHDATCSGTNTRRHATRATRDTRRPSTPRHAQTSDTHRHAAHDTRHATRQHGTTRGSSGLSQHGTAGTTRSISDNAHLFALG